MIRAGVIALLLAAGGPPTAQETLPGAPVSDAVVRDVEFGVTARHFGLERRVEMLQWRPSRQGYSKAWDATPVDSSSFAPGHENPEFPLRSRRWIAEAITIDGKPLDAQVISRAGEWRGFRPNFSSLPAHLAAKFQPEGDGLGSAENPLAPGVGDLRITWRELILPSLGGRIELHGSRWMPSSIGKESPTPITIAAPEDPFAHRYAVSFGIAAVVLALALWAHRQRHRRERDAKLQPKIG